MTSRTPPADTPIATGIASGSLGTGTAVDDETTRIIVAEAPEATDQRTRAVAAASRATGAPATATAAPAASAPAAQAAPEPAPTTADLPSKARRDPYRPIGIALAAVLVALVGVAVLSSGGDTPAQIGGPPAVTASPANAVAGEEDEVDEGDGSGKENKGNGRGNGNGGDNGRGND